MEKSDSERGTERKGGEKLGKIGRKRIMMNIQ